MSLSQTFRAEGEGNRGFLRRRWNRRLLSRVLPRRQSVSIANFGRLPASCNCPACQPTLSRPNVLRSLLWIGGALLLANEVRGVIFALAFGPSILSAVWNGIV